MDILPLIAQATQPEATSNIGLGLGLGGVCIGMGLMVAGAARGIGNIGGNAVEAIARQPEAKGSIGANMIIAAALIEGFTFFALVVAMVVMGKLH